ncbi:uncharacterized protein EDB93DRAFT_1271364 [Suillus bovinus]|uniref:uncharacterized protein n=1 Tax=Suillus bovinus TaxID=48563 RepID=UPI001B866AF2|nr:uncharacterized protein EDB93DRAFT_1271364 [Suillus bovinus]KAG2153557.1 hypothetical protein EDB93DRAFT_1271364 [Suillus bovinus]
MRSMTLFGKRAFRHHWFHQPRLRLREPSKLICRLYHRDRRGQIPYYKECLCDGKKNLMTVERELGRPPYPMGNNKQRRMFNTCHGQTGENVPQNGILLTNGCLERNDPILPAQIAIAGGIGLPRGYIPRGHREYAAAGMAILICPLQHTGDVGASASCDTENLKNLELEFYELPLNLSPFLGAVALLPSYWTVHRGVGGGAKPMAFS